MGLFDSPKAKYSQTLYQLSADTIEGIASSVRIQTLDQAEGDLVQEELIAARSGGKISLRKIYEVLTKLEQSHKISQYDKKGLLTAFQTHVDSL